MSTSLYIIVMAMWPLLVMMIWGVYDLANTPRPYAKAHNRSHDRDDVRHMGEAHPRPA